ncbi:PadR family transcriptional regulator [Methanococcus maripaludis]|uniref:Lineage-specific thermal regulator protein n=1 Tax=Methanococcus maripaludis TaxID=39152 RepID=A0A2L1C8F5_METMI|nr:PadR family transcriptional regulator [Methanococcus maripaludis]AVB75635.1 lineage-specific thermal regulator protein [Methanococcus maripaludis]MBA2863970.1 PadR family transcriptional regulator PadR [Methanococcus maripaludis]MBB6496033.1 PadR family transcriptional regulator PadR [Methanococcus maripaludis]
MDVQFKKGVLELCVLTLLNKRDYYGYELINEISKSISISEGTIYPLLRRLKADGLLTTYLMESSSGPPRKYYKLTEKGKEVRESQAEEWIEFSKKVNELINSGVKDE